VSRRVKLPGASELFRPTGSETTSPATVRSEVGAPAERSTAERSLEGRPPEVQAREQVDGASPATGGSGRVRHEEKITVYVSRDELLAIEQARLRLRGELGLAVDRGRLVRAAMALALADLEAAGTDGELVRRLTAS
jgi:hypothetical protein